MLFDKKSAGGLEESTHSKGKGSKLECSNCRDIILFLLSVPGKVFRRNIIQRVGRE